jgi:hypothetical protein
LAGCFLLLSNLSGIIYMLGFIVFGGKSTTKTRKVVKIMTNAKSTVRSEKHGFRDFRVTALTIT